MDGMGNGGNLMIPESLPTKTAANQTRIFVLLALYCHFHWGKASQRPWRSQLVEVFHGWPVQEGARVPSFKVVIIPANPMKNHGCKWV